MTSSNMTPRAVRGLGIVGLCVLLGACASTDPGEAASIKYRMPETQAEVTTRFELRSCQDDEFRKQADAANPPSLCFHVQHNLKTTHGAGDKVYEVKGLDLASSTVARDIGISVNDKGVLMGINTKNTDKTASIVGSALSLAASFAGFAVKNARDTTPHPHCTDCSVKTQQTFELIDSTTKDIEAHRQKIEDLEEEASQLAKQGNKQQELVALRGEIDQLKKLVDNLATMVADKRLNDLTLSTTNPIKLREASKAPQSLIEDWSDFEDKDWLNDDTKPATEFGIIYKLTDQPEFLDSNNALIRTAAAGTKTPKSCRLSIPVPHTVPTNLTLELSKNALPKQERTFELPFSCPTQENGIKQCQRTMGKEKVSGPTELCIDVRFGEDRTVNLAFDEYGRKKSMTWGSTARADTVMSSLAGYATTASGLVDTLGGQSDLERKTSEVTRLTTEQSYNRLKACEAIIEAGGYTCPE